MRLRSSRFHADAALRRVHRGHALLAEYLYQSWALPYSGEGALAAMLLPVSCARGARIAGVSAVSDIRLDCGHTGPVRSLIALKPLTRTHSTALRYPPPLHRACTPGIPSRRACCRRPRRRPRRWVYRSRSSTATATGWTAPPPGASCACLLGTRDRSVDRRRRRKAAPRRRPHRRRARPHLPTPQMRPVVVTRPPTPSRWLRCTSCREPGISCFWRTRWSSPASSWRGALAAACRLRGRRAESHRWVRTNKPIKGRFRSASSGHSGAGRPG